MCELERQHIAGQLEGVKSTDLLCIAGQLDGVNIMVLSKMPGNGIQYTFHCCCGFIA